MREYGLRYAVLINPRDYGWDNSYVSYSLDKYPNRFVAHGLINPEDPKVVERLRYWVKEHGFQGMRFSPLHHPNSTWLNSKAHYPLWREAERLGVVFNFYILPHQMPMLEDMVGRFSGVKVVVDHLGEPDLKGPDPWTDFRKMFRMKKFSQVWISASEPYEISLEGFPYRDTWPFFKAVYQEFGGKQLIWGTGYPGRAGSCRWTRSWHSWIQCLTSTPPKIANCSWGRTLCASGNFYPVIRSAYRISRHDRILTVPSPVNGAVGSGTG